MRGKINVNNMVYYAEHYKSTHDIFGMFAPAENKYIEFNKDVQKGGIGTDIDINGGCQGSQNIFVLLCKSIYTFMIFTQFKATHTYCILDQCTFYLILR